MTVMTAGGAADSLFGTPLGRKSQDNLAADAAAAPPAPS